ncbi:MAG: LCP family protein [Oscillospiraceae bacterium]|nr:LCP family protein [Oscillospiraceae bacterium]
MLSSLRNFFISLFITLIVFGIAAYFLTGFINEILTGFTGSQPLAENGDTEKTTENNSVISENLDTNVFTVLVLGIDDGQSQPKDYETDAISARKEADSIFLININAKTRTIMVSSLPCNLKVEADGFVLCLGSVYSYGGVELVKKTVWSYTGMTADYCFVLDYDSVEVIIDSLGEMEYAILEDMYYKPVPYDSSTTNPPTDEAEEPEETEETTNRNIINIKKSEQETNESGAAVIDGAAAIQILRYKNYKNDQYNRDATQINFLREFIKQKMTVENLARADEIYEKIKDSIVAADMDEKTFKKYAETLFSLHDYEVAIVVYPGAVKTENGTTFLEPILKSAIERYDEYRKVEDVDLNATESSG